MNDRRIIELFFARDEEALDGVRRKYGRYLYGIAYSILGGDSDAEECVNDAYLQLWNSIPPNSPADLRSYAGAVCRRLAFNRLETAKAQKRGGGQVEAAYEELAEVLSEGGDFSDGIALRDSLDRFLRSLTRDARLVFVQKYWYMRSVREIAADLGQSESAVKSSLFRTRKLLAEHLRKEGFDL